MTLQFGLLGEGDMELVRKGQSRRVKSQVRDVKAQYHTASKDSKSKELEFESHSKASVLSSPEWGAKARARVETPSMGNWIPQVPGASNRKQLWCWGQAETQLLPNPLHPNLGFLSQLSITQHQLSSPGALHLSGILCDKAGVRDQRALKRDLRGKQPSVTPGLPLWKPPSQTPGLGKPSLLQTHSGADQTAGAVWPPPPCWKLERIMEPACFPVMSA